MSYRRRIERARLSITGGRGRRTRSTPERSGPPGWPDPAGRALMKIPGEFEAARGMRVRSLRATGFAEAPTWSRFFPDLDRVTCATHFCSVDAPRRAGQLLEARLENLFWGRDDARERWLGLGRLFRVSVFDGFRRCLMED